MSYRESIVREYACDVCHRTDSPRGKAASISVPKGWLRVSVQAEDDLHETTYHVCDSCTDAKLGDLTMPVAS